MLVPAARLKEYSGGDARGTHLRYGQREYQILPVHEERPVNVMRTENRGRFIGKRTRCEIPRAPPPPRTTPIDFPHILLARRAKSLICWGRRGRGSERSLRYLWISLWTRSFIFLRATTAAGSGGAGGARATDGLTP